MKFINHAEGYIEPDGGGGYNYVYQYKDHLGNVRLSYSDANGNGAVDNTEIVEESNYYPFGLKHRGYNDVVNGMPNKFLTYNGKEFEETLGFNMHEMDMRHYDPAIVRWVVQDPVTHHSMSPYVAFDNNPALIADPGGADGMIGTHGSFGWTLWNGMMGTQQIGFDYSGLSGQFNNTEQKSSSINVEDSENTNNISDEEWEKLIKDSTALEEVIVTHDNKKSYNAAISNIVGQIYATDWYSSHFITPWGVGMEWLTGKGPRERYFSNGDYFTELLRQHSHIEETKRIISEQIKNGGGLEGSRRYSLGGIQGVGKYMKDYSTLLTAGKMGNLAVTYLGSYSLKWKASITSNNSALITFSVVNHSTMQSASRPPVLGYMPAWQNTVGKAINNYFSTGWGSKTTQYFNWTETISW